MLRIITANLLPIVSAVIMVGITIGLSLVVYQSERGMVLDEHLSRMERETINLAGDVNNRLTTLSLAIRATAQFISHLAREMPGDSPIGNLRGYLVNITRNLPELRTIIVIDPSGLVTDDLRPGQPAVGIDVHDRAYFRSHKTGAQLGIHVADPVTSRVDGKWVWPMSIAARGENGKLLAIVLSSVDVNYFGVSIDSPVSSQALESLIIHQNGTLLQVTNQEESNVALKISDFSLINTAKKEGMVVSESTTDPYGRTNLLAIAMKVPNWPVFVVNLLDRKVLDDPLNRLRMFIIGFAGVACLMILFVAYFQVLHNSQRARAGESLRANEERYQFLLKSGLEGIIVLEQGTITDVSDTTAEMFGYRLEEMIGMRILDLIATEFKEITTKHTVEGHHGLHESMGLRNDGSIFPLEVHGQNSQFKGRQVRVVAMRDITERFRAQQELRESENRFTRAVQGTYDGIWDWNIITDEQYLSPRWLEILGYEQGDFDPTRETIANMVYPEDRDRWQEATDAHLREQVPYDLEFRMLRKDGEPIWIRSRGQAVLDESGKPILMAGAIRDITARKQMEEELRASQRLLQTVFETTPIGIGVKDLSGRYLMVNSSLAAIYGRSPHDLLDKTFEELGIGTKAQKKNVMEDDRRVIENGEVIDNPEALLLLPDGKAIWRRRIKAPLQDDTGAIIGIVGVMEDITQRKLAEQELRASNQLLETIFASIPIGLSVKDREFKYLMLNQEIAGAMGGTPEELVGQTGWDSWPGTDSQLKELMEIDKKVLDTESLVDVSESLVGVQGKETWAHVIKAPLPAEGGGTAGIVTARVDITEHKKAGEGRSRLMMAVEQISEAVVITDANGLANYANPAFERITGYSREEVLGQNLRFLQSGEQDSQFYKNLWETITNGEVWEGTLTNRKKDGSFYREEMTISPILDTRGGINSFIAVKRDITERFSADELIRTSEKRFRGLIENSMLPLMVVQNLKPLFANRSFVNQFRFGSQEEFLAMPDVTVTMRPEDVAALSDEHLEDMKGKFARQSYERIAIRADGTQFHALIFLESVDWENSPALLVTFIDMTDRHIAQAALAQSESWNTTILNGTADGIIVMDQEGTITELNPAAEKIFGYPANEAVGKQLVNLFVPQRFKKQHLAGVEKTLRNAFEEHTDLNFEVLGLRKDGSEVPLEMVVNTIISDGRIYFSVFIRDITERKKAEEKIELQQEQLLQADKLASLGTLVSGVAHEINNPNAIITLNVPSLKEFWKDALPILDAHHALNGELTLGSIPYDRIRDDIPAMLDDIKAGSDRIRVIVDNLKNFVRQGVGGKRRAVSLNKVVQTAVDLVGARIRKATIHFHSELSDDLPLVEGNLQELEQVVINLLTNSCDALTGTDEAISISTVFDQKNHQVMIVLADEGEGIPQENMSRIKDPFFTTKQELGGTGLGLSVSHGIIENHYGSLEFSCPPEGGTVATITLPVQST